MVDIVNCNTRDHVGDLPCLHVKLSMIFYLAGYKIMSQHDFFYAITHNLITEATGLSV